MKTSPYHLWEKVCTQQLYSSLPQTGKPRRPSTGGWSSAPGDRDSAVPLGNSKRTEPGTTLIQRANLRLTLLSGSEPQRTTRHESIYMTLGDALRWGDRKQMGRGAVVGAGCGDRRRSGRGCGHSIGPRVLGLCAIKTHRIYARGCALCKLCLRFSKTRAFRSPLPRD